VIEIKVNLKISPIKAYFSSSMLNNQLGATNFSYGDPFPKTLSTKTMTPDAKAAVPQTKGVVG